MPQAWFSGPEGPQALFAGPDGLDVIRRLVGMLDGVPWVALEVGFDQADAVAGLVREVGFSSAERLRDLAGHELCRFDGHQASVTSVALAPGGRLALTGSLDGTVRLLKLGQ